MRNFDKIALLVFLAGFIGLSALIAGCGNPKSSARIVCTTGMVRDVVQTLVGTNETVVALMGSGVDPHLYDPLGPDIAALNSAEIVFYTGLHLEGKMGELLEDLEKKGKTVVAVGEAIPENLLIKEGGGAKDFDPHVWMSVSTWTEIIDPVLDTLSKAQPGKADAFGANAAALRAELAAFGANSAALRAELAELDGYVKKCIGAIPPDARILITAHDAFAYFGRDYGLEVEGIQGISTDDEAGLERINELVDLLVTRKIPAVFVESTVPPKHVAALIEGAKSKGHDVRIGGELFSDAMGADGSYEGTYLGMIDHNATIISRALGGADAAPEKGRTGKLSGEQK